MTIETCLELVNTVMPDGIPEAVKLRLLGEIEGQVWVELLGEEPDGTAVFDGSTPVDTELSAPHPFDRLYWLYLVAMTDCVSGNTARYENAAMLFNAAYQSYGKWLKRRGA
jgi:hypothetical protein